MDKLLGKVREGISHKAGNRIPGSHEDPQGAWDAPPTNRDLYLYRRQRGVNLGSFFTLEKWLTPSLFDGVSGHSEHDLCRTLDAHQAKERLEKHWNSFVDQGDWKWMKSNGVNTVRLPISYYHWLPGHPDPKIQALMKDTDFEPYVDIYRSAHASVIRQIEIASQHGIGVLVDLHGAPGGQNSEGHCGLSTGKAAFFERSKHRKVTLDILSSLQDALAPYENVIGLELLNEPKNSDKLPGWYEEAIQELCRSRPNAQRLPLYFGDCWSTQQYSQLLAKQQGSNDARVFLVQDHHLYRCFTDQDHRKKAEQHAAEISPGQGGPSLSMLTKVSQSIRGNIVIGEWSAALHPTSLSSDGGARLQGQRAWAQAQLDAFNAVCGGFYFWTLKKEGKPDPGWCLYSAVEKGVLPRGLGRSDVDKVRQRLIDLGPQRVEEAYKGHVTYWDAQAKSSQMSHEKFHDAFEQTWKDCLAFLEQPGGGEEIGFGGQWIAVRAQAYAKHCGNTHNEWEFTHGAHQAIDSFKKDLYSS